MPEPAVELSGNWQESVEAAWRCQLTPQLVSRVELVCRVILTQQRNAKQQYSRKEMADCEKRHRAIARLATELRALLEADAGSFYPVWTRLEKLNAKGLAALQVPLARIEAQRPGVLERYPRPEGRPSDMWSLLIREMIKIYTKGAGKAPPAAEHSWFVSGLCALHNALPEDVRMKSTRPLASRVREMLDPDRKKRKKRRA